MEQNKIDKTMQSAIDKIKEVLDTDTVIGEKIDTPAGAIIPITKVSVGFVAGGGEYSAGEKQIKALDTFPFAGGTGAGVSVQPIGFLVIQKDKINFVRVDGKTALDKFLDDLPKMSESIAESIKECKHEK